MKERIQEPIKRIAEVIHYKRNQQALDRIYESERDPEGVDAVTLVDDGFIPQAFRDPQNPRQKK